MKKKFKILIGLGLLLTLTIIISFSPGPLEKHTTQKMVSASKVVVWDVISDVANYHEYATGLSSVSIISGEGVGMVRSCSDDNGTWMETCTMWKEGHSYAFDVNVNSGFPFPFKKFNGTWTVNEVDDHFSELLIEFEYQFPYKWMSWFFGNDTHELIHAGNLVLIENWEKEIYRLNNLSLNDE